MVGSLKQSGILKGCAGAHKDLQGYVMVHRGAKGILVLLI